MYSVHLVNWYNLFLSLWVESLIFRGLHRRKLVKSTQSDEREIIAPDKAACWRSPTIKAAKLQLTFCTSPKILV